MNVNFDFERLKNWQKRAQPLVISLKYENKIFNYS